MEIEPPENDPKKIAPTVEGGGLHVKSDCNKTLDVYAMDGNELRRGSC
jgi:hypothetical protein